MYDVRSRKATEFIDDAEVLASLAYGEEHKTDRALIESLIERAEDCKGLTHREAAVLLECQLPDLNERMFALARRIKEKLYGNRIVMFAPLYLSNYCVNGCVYCPYHAKNKHIRRKKLSQEEIAREVIALQDMGHKRLALETGEDPVNNPIEYVLESIKTIYGIHHKNGAIRRVNVNIAATTVENYRPGDLQQKAVRGPPPHGAQERLRLPHRGHGPGHGGGHRRCGLRGALRAESVPLRLRGTADARRAPGGRLRRGPPHHLRAPDLPRRRH